MFIKSYWRTVKRKNPARAAKCLKDNNYKASILRENVLLYLSLNVICSSKLAVFLEIRSRKLFASWNR